MLLIIQNITLFEKKQYLVSNFGRKYLFIERNKNFLISISKFNFANNTTIKYTID